MEERLSFRRALNRVAAELGRQDLDNLKFMCKDVIPESKLEKTRSALDLFTSLEERGKLGVDNLEFLTNCLATIGRHRTLSHLRVAGFSVPDPTVNGSSPVQLPSPVSQQPPSSTSPSSEEFLFRQLLMQIAQQLQSNQVDQLAFNWCEPYLGITRENIYSATQLFTLMQQRDIITPSNLDLLYHELNEIGRRDLMKLIDDYQAKTGQKKSAFIPSYQPQGCNGTTFSNPPSYSSTPPDAMPGHYPRPDDLSIPSTPSSGVSDIGSTVSHPTPVSEHSASGIRYPPSISGSYRMVVPQGNLNTTAMQQPGVGDYMQHHQIGGQFNTHMGGNGLYSHSATDNKGDQSTRISSKEDSPPAFPCNQPFFNPSPILTFKPDMPPDEYTRLLQTKNSELAQKEGEIRQLMGQLSRATVTQDRQNIENTEMIRMHKLAIVQLQDDLKLKNSELNKLRQEMKDLYSAITSGGKGEEYYHMPSTPHGVCLIINNYLFHQVDPRFDALSERGGASVDQRNLVLTFEFLQYKVEVHENCTSVQMIDLMKEMTFRDHSQYDSFICCILSHGEEGKVFGADSLPVDLRDITGVIKGTYCRSLIDKPKLFFVQACRGETEDPGIKVVSDGNSLPVEADFLFGYATPPGNAAYRSRRHGSWFISELCQVFSQDSQVLGLGSMMKKVNRKVSDAYTKEGHKQCTEVVDRLRKEVHFFRDYSHRR